MAYYKFHLIFWIPRLYRYQNHEYYERAKYYNSIKSLGLQKYSKITEKEASRLNERKREYEIKFCPKKNSWTGNSLLNDSKMLDENSPTTVGLNKFYEFLYCQIYKYCSQVVHSSYAGIKRGTTIIRIKENNSEKYLHIPNIENHLAFQGVFTILSFLSSIRFSSILCKKHDIESYYQKHCKELLEE